MKSKTKILLSFVILASVFAGCFGAPKNNAAIRNDNKQLTLQTKETSPPNFIRLVLMRLIYGIASQLGYEERISGLFNGALVPPNADDDDGGLFDFDGADLFDDDY